MKLVYGALGQVDILAIGVHPDDVELSCCATLLKHIDKGYSVGLLDLTKGELGTRGNASIRVRESALAAEFLKANFRINLEMEDCFFEVNELNINNISEIIRKSRPHIILANAPDDRHPDHGKAADLVARSFFYSGLKKIKIDQTEPYRANTLYHYIQDKNLIPDLCVDVTGYVDQKMKAIMTFSSQFYDPDSAAPDTPISSPQFLDFILAKMKSFGRSIGVDYAEGFICNRTIGLEDLFSLK